MPEISSNFTQLTDLDPVLNEIFFNHYTQHAPKAPLMFGVRSSDKAKETDFRIDGFTDPQPLRGRIEYQTVNRDYEIEYRHTEYASGFVVERSLFDDMQYDSIFGQASEMGTAFFRKREKDAASVFNSAFDTGVIGYDGKALCANDHPRSRSDATSVDNALALALTPENLETAITTMQSFKDGIGEEITIMPNVLLVPRALRKTALELTESELTPQSAENAINVHAGLQTVWWDYLTDPNAWFVLDTTMSRRYLKWFDRVPTEFGAEEDFDTFYRKFRGYMRYSYGWSDWRWIIGSNPS